MQTNYRWYVLVLAVFTATLVVAGPMMAVPVLFDEISTELDLSLAQIGEIWGAGSLMAIGTGLIGGTLGDRFGSRRVIMLACLTAGISGAARGFSTDYLSLLITMLLAGTFPPMVIINLHKLCADWFPSEQLGLANGAISSGMALGFLTGSLFSATVLSPLLGGWKQVLFFYGGLAILLSGIWFWTQNPPEKANKATNSILKNLPEVMKLRNVWILALVGLGIGSCTRGFFGYVPLYLRDNLDWTAANADSALALFHGVSLCAAIPLALLSDRTGKRRLMLMGSAFMLASGVSAFSVVAGGFVWLAMIWGGLTRDGFMSIFMTAVAESKGVGARLAGTATGFVSMFMGIGGVLSPPIGNRFASIHPGAPFLFWGGMAIFSLFMLMMIERTEPKVVPAVV